MVQIQEQEDIDDAQHQVQPHHHHQQNQASSSNMNHATSSPPPHLHHDSPSSASSISSDHTFHGFSPPKSHLPSPSPAPSPAPPPPSLLPIVSAGRLVRDQPEVVTKTESDAETGFVAASPARKPRRPAASVLSHSRREKIVKRVGLALRFFEFAACLVSFSVMASDKRRGWAVDSFDRYIEFRYSMTVNVISFAYSGLQGLDLLRQLTMGKDPVRSQFRNCFDFAMDQTLAYLLLSSASSAFTRVDDWISNWGKDKFPAMASAAVGVSILGFISFALSSLVSGYTLSTHRHSL
ncbi:hypothetical protein RND81_04G051100 [Saponaria officinalis]|uniref:CASP-like protein n=1 Tax=Saponaria officinalis TaxID=3572 RepID=A0AAW1LD27_SAPOF